MRAMKPWLPASSEAIVPGITLIEASAGTGKTYNIASLVVRLVAECNVLMREIVVVTFTRAATAELKDRVRERISRAIAMLESGGAPQDEMMALLRPEHLPNLRAAQESFDECLLSTIHGFCQRMLQQHAFEAKTGFDLEMVPDTTELIDEVVDDWLSSNLHADAARYAFIKETCELNRDKLTRLATLALRDPDVPVEPAPGSTALSEWSVAREAVAARWDGAWAGELPAFIENARKGGTLKKRQSTYTADKCRDRMAEVSQWLRGAALPGEPPHVDYFSESGLARQLADGAQAPSHEALSALQGLRELKDRIIASELASIVQWFRTEFDRRMSARRAQSYQDLLRNLARTLAVPGAEKDALVGAIGSRYRAALIDEFQDTDAQQWTIFRELFGDEKHWLYLIGDPKQAIYDFRGANVHVYLAARRYAKERAFTIGCNYRSDQRMLEAFHHLMDRPGFFCEEGIDYVTVGPHRAPEVPQDRIRYTRPWHDPATAPLQLRFIDRRLEGARSVGDDDKALAKDAVCQWLPARVSDDVVELLQSGAELYGGEGGWRALGPADVAVLTATGKQAVDVHEALTRAGVPAVLHVEENVLAKEEALDVQRWLQALAAPGNDGLARVAATSRLFGRTATRIAQVDAQDKEALAEWEQWLDRLASWRALFAKQGFWHAFRTALHEDTLGSQDVVTRLLQRVDGERRLTNVWHVAELVHQAQISERLALAGVISWLKRQRAEARSTEEAAEMRLERDDQAVSVMTMHKSKGLEFPVVFVPFLFDVHAAGKGAVIVPRPGCPGQRVFDLRGAYMPEVRERAERENQKQQLRLLYVALTRARLRCVLYTGHTRSLETTGLAPALHGEPRDGLADRIEAGRARAGASRPELWNELSRLCSEGGRADRSPLLALTWCDQPKGVRWTGPAAAEPVLQVRDFARPALDRRWRRHSYSSIAHGHASLAQEEREGFDADPEQEHAGAAAQGLPPEAAPEHARDVPLADFPRGTEAGTFLHAVFEHADFVWAHPDAGPEAQGKLRGVVEELLLVHGYDVTRWGEAVHGATLRILRTPLGGPLRSTRLCDIPASARLNELRFDIPLAGGNHARPDVFVASGQIMEAMRLRKKPTALAADEEVVRTAWLDAAGGLPSIAGFMTGSIDLVFRHDVEGVPQWFVVDYKSNRLDPHGTGRCPIEHFAHPFLRHAMEQNNYYLQYHIYLLALHRYVRLRAGAAGYDYERDIGGACYLFLRGMLGEETPVDEANRRFGCFHDKPPKRVIGELDRVLSDPSKAGEP